MSDEYDNWSLAQLRKEVDKLQKLIEQREKKERKAALAELRAVARKNGFSLAELLEQESPAKPAGNAASKPKKKKTAARKGAKVKPRYRHPQQPDTTWSGRGRKPAWVQAHLERGGRIEELEIR